MAVIFEFDQSTRSISYHVPEGHKPTAEEAAAIAQIEAAQTLTYLETDVSDILRTLQSKD